MFSRVSIFYFWMLTFGLLLFACVNNEDDEGSQFVPLTRTHIRVNVNEDFKDTMYVSAFSYSIIPNALSKSEEVILSESGEYLLQLQIDKPTIAELVINNKQYKIVVYPSDTSNVLVENYKLEEEEDMVRVIYSGKGSEIIEYFQKKEVAFGYYDVRMPIANLTQPNSTYDKLKQQVDSVMQLEIGFFEDYCSRHELPAWFLKNEKYHLQYGALSHNTAIKRTNKFFDFFKDSISEDYYNYLEDVAIDNSEAIYSWSYYWFLKSYFYKTVFEENPEIDTLSNHERSMKLADAVLRGANAELSGDAKKYFKQYIFSNVIERFSDISQVDSLAVVYGIDEYLHLLDELGTRINNTKRSKGLDLITGDTIPLLLLVDAKEELRSLKEFGDKVTYINIWATWCGPCIKNFPEYNKMVDKYAEDDRVQFINICMRSERDKWKKLIGKHEVGGINLYASGNWNDKLGSIFSLEGIPHYVLLDQGNVLFKNFAEKAPLVEATINSLIQDSD